jgi:hypothetical protein
MFDDEMSNDLPKPERDEHGRWKKGTRAPNPGGYTKAQREARRDVREAAKRLTPLALKTLQRIMENPKAPASAKAQAAGLVIDRAWGKMPVVAIAEQPREVIVRWIGEGGGDDDAARMLAIDPAGRRAGDPHPCARAGAGGLRRPPAAHLQRLAGVRCRGSRAGLLRDGCLGLGSSAAGLYYLYGGINVGITKKPIIYLAKSNIYGGDGGCRTLPVWHWSVCIFPIHRHRGLYTPLYAAIVSIFFNSRGLENHEDHKKKSQNSFFHRSY